MSNTFNDRNPKRRRLSGTPYSSHTGGPGNTGDLSLLAAVSASANAASTTASALSTTANAASETASALSTTASALSTTANAASETASALSASASALSASANAVSASANALSTTANAIFFPSDPFLIAQTMELYSDQYSFLDLNTIKKARENETVKESRESESKKRSDRRHRELCISLTIFGQTRGSQASNAKRAGDTVLKYLLEENLQEYLSATKEQRSSRVWIKEWFITPIIGVSTYEEGGLPCLMATITGGEYWLYSFQLRKRASSCFPRLFVSGRKCFSTKEELLQAFRTLTDSYPIRSLMDQAAFDYVVGRVLIGDYSPGKWIPRCFWDIKPGVDQKEFDSIWKPVPPMNNIVLDHL